MPVPLVTAMADHARYLHGLGALRGGTQADQGSLPYSPWNHYAYPRLLWNSQRTADELLEEFFSGYFREAKGPMLAYYRTLEDHLIHHDVSLHPQGNYQYGVTPGAFSYSGAGGHAPSTWNRPRRRPPVGSWPSAGADPRGV